MHLAYDNIVHNRSYGKKIKHKSYCYGRPFIKEKSKNEEEKI